MIQRGNIVRDKVTGFTGVVKAITYWLNKCVRVDVQPVGLKGGKVQDAHAFDIEQVQFVKKGKVPAIPLKPANPGVVLGCEAKDTITSFSGIVIARVEWLSGYQGFVLQPRKLSDEKVPIPGQNFDAEHVVYVGRGVNPEEIKKSATGGPMPNVSGRH